jgi:hypothetical protein
VNLEGRGQHIAAGREAYAIMGKHPNALKSASSAKAIAVTQKGITMEA